MASNTVLKGFFSQILEARSTLHPCSLLPWPLSTQLPDELLFFLLFSKARKSFCRMKYPERAAGLAGFVKQLLNSSTNTWHWAGAGPGNIHQDLLLKCGIVLWVENFVVKSQKGCKSLTSGITQQYIP